MPVETGPPSRNSESPLIPGVMDASRPPSDLLQGWSIIAERFDFVFVFTDLTQQICLSPISLDLLLLIIDLRIIIRYVIFM